MRHASSTEHKESSGKESERNHAEQFSPGSLSAPMEMESMSNHLFLLLRRETEKTDKVFEVKRNRLVVPGVMCVIPGSWANVGVPPQIERGDRLSGVIPPVHHHVHIHEEVARAAAALVCSTGCRHIKKALSTGRDVSEDRACDDEPAFPVHVHVGAIEVAIGIALAILDVADTLRTRDPNASSLETCPCIG